MGVGVSRDFEDLLSCFKQQETLFFFLCEKQTNKETKTTPKQTKTKKGKQAKPKRTEPMWAIDRENP